MTTESLVIFLVVGLIAGFLAGILVRGYGLEAVWEIGF